MPGADTPICDSGARQREITMGLSWAENIRSKDGWARSGNLVPTTVLPREQDRPYAHLWLGRRFLFPGQSLLLRMYFSEARILARVVSAIHPSAWATDSALTQKLLRLFPGESSKE